MKKLHNGDVHLTPAEAYDLREFILDVLNIINYDDTGVTDDLIDKAEIAAEIIGLSQKVEYENEPWADE